MAERHTAGDGGRATTGPRCPRCGEALVARHCKYVCPNHGVVVDCADPFL